MLWNKKPFRMFQLTLKKMYIPSGGGIISKKIRAQVFPWREFLVRAGFLKYHTLSPAVFRTLLQVVADDVHNTFIRSSFSAFYTEPRPKPNLFYKKEQGKTE